MALYIPPVTELYPDNESALLYLHDIECYDDLKFQKRAHGGIKAFNGGQSIDIIKGPRERLPHIVYFDNEFEAAYCMMMTSDARLRDFKDFLQSFITRGDVPYLIKRYTNIFNPERGLYDHDNDKLTDECVRMVHFSDDLLFDSDLCRLKRRPERETFLEDIGIIKLPAADKLYARLGEFQNFLNRRNKYNSEYPAEKILDSPLFELKINLPESSAENIACVEILSNNGSGRKVYVAQHKLTPLGQEFYKYCSSEKPEEFDEIFERKYTDYGLLRKDGTLSTDGVNILSVLHAKQSIA